MEKALIFIPEHIAPPCIDRIKSGTVAHLQFDHGVRCLGPRLKNEFSQREAGVRGSLEGFHVQVGRRLHQADKYKARFEYC